MRSVLALLSGIIVSFVVISGIQLINGLIYPMESSVMSNPELLQNYIDNLPIQAFLVVLFSYAGGSFLGALLIAVIDKKREIMLAIILGIILTITGFMNLFSINHPLWFAIVSSLIYIPMCYFGARVGKKKKNSKIV